MYQAHIGCPQAVLNASGFQQDTENTIQSSAFFSANVEMFL